jgi:hypothetical protein
MTSTRRDLSAPSLWCGLPLIAYLVFAGPAVSRADEQQRKVSESCGPQALVAAFALGGQQVEPSQCATLAATSPQGITTLSGLQKAARALGGRVHGMCLTPAELALLDRVAILHAAVPGRPDHYLVFASCENGLFKVLNPTRSRAPQYFTSQQLKLTWDGNCLVFTPTAALDLVRVGVHRMYRLFMIAAGTGLGLWAAVIFSRRVFRGTDAAARRQRQRRALLGGLCAVTMLALTILITSLSVFATRRLFLERGPRLVLGASVVDFGDVARGRSASMSVWVANAGRRELQIDEEGVKTSCACVAARLSRTTLPSRARQVLRIDVGPKSRLGPFEHSVRVACRAPAGGQVLKVRGNIVGPGVAYPPRLYFGQVGRDTQNPVKSFLYLARYPQTKIIDIACDAPYLKCRLVDEKPGAAQFEASLIALPNEEYWEGNITVATTDSPSEKITIPFAGATKTP